MVSRPVGPPGPTPSSKFLLYVPFFSLLQLVPHELNLPILQRLWGRGSGQFPVPMFGAGCVDVAGMFGRSICRQLLGNMYRSYAYASKMSPKIMTAQAPCLQTSLK